MTAGPTSASCACRCARASPVATQAQLRNAPQLMPHRDDAMIENVVAFKTHAVAQVREGGSVNSACCAATLATPATTRATWRLTSWPTTPCSRRPASSTPTARFTYNSLTTPTSTYEAELATGKLHLLKVQPVQGGYDASRYASERLWFKDDRWHPGAGQSGLPQGPAQERPAAAAALRLRQLRHPDRPALHQPAPVAVGPGVIFAIAHIRGGGDLGRRWYLDGKLAKKMNTFTDFITCAEGLVARGYTSPRSSSSRAAVRGGLLMGAVTNLRPDLFKAVVAPGAVCGRDQHHARRHLPLTGRGTSNGATPTRR